MRNSQDLSRRALLSAAAVAASTLIVSTPASAAAIPKTAVSYQETPKDGHQCSGCKLFIPGPSADANGTCKSVSGEIHPNGWCKLFAPKDA
jgi:hypothetical protein